MLAKPRPPPIDGSPKQPPPHPATVAQRKPPHPATVAQRKPPHPATALPRKPPHPATSRPSTLQRSTTSVDLERFQSVFAPSDKELWLQWKEKDPIPEKLYVLLRYFQDYLRDADKVFIALKQLDSSNVMEELEKVEKLGGFESAVTTESESDTDKFLDLIVKKIPLVDVAADKNTPIEDVKHGRLMHRIQWYIIAVSLADDGTGQELFGQAGLETLADAYAASAKYRREAQNGKTVAPWTGMVDRPVIRKPERLKKPDATIPENLGALLFAGNFANIIAAEDALWPYKLYTSCMPFHPALKR